MKRLRKPFEDGHLDGELFGVIESDEVLFGKRKKQQIVLGMVEREGSVKFFLIIDRQEDQLYCSHTLLANFVSHAVVCISQENKKTVR